MIKLKTKMSTLPALIAGLMLAVPVAEASVEGAMLTFSPGKGLKPSVQIARGTPGAGQQVTTGASEVREILFPDGTSVTLGPGSDIKVEAFDYLETGGGRLVLRVDRGLVRVAGGALNERAPIVVKTAAGEVRLDAASAVVEVNAEGRTRASMLAGRGVTLQNDSQTQSVQRPGFELVSLAGRTPPEAPARQPEGGAARDAFGLGTAQLSGLTKAEEDQLGRAGLSELAAAGAVTLALATEQQPPGTTSSSPGAGNPGPGGTPPIPSPPPSPGFAEIGPTAGGGANAGFTLSGGALNPDNLYEVLPSDQNGDRRALVQNRGNASVVNGRLVEPTRRLRAPTTNRLFSSGDAYSQVITASAPTAVLDRYRAADGTAVGDSRLEYIFKEDAGSEANFPGIQLFGVNQMADTGLSADHVLLGSNGNNFDSSAPFLLNKLTGLPSGEHWPAPGVRAVVADIPEQPPVDFSGNGTNFVRRDFSGSIFKTASHWEILQAGFNIGERPAEAGGNRLTMLRADDNFLLMEVRPGKLDATGQPELNPTRPERFLFATGGVDKGRITDTGDRNTAFTNTFAADRFFISAGLENFEQKDIPGRTVASNIRAFLPGPSSLGLSLADSGLFVINTGSNAPQAQNGLLHADFGMQGTGGVQQSTLSVTLGAVDYRPDRCDTCDIKYAFDAVASGRTIASSRGNVAPNQVGTVAISSPLMSTASGGGNPQLNRDGYAGYFVLENYKPPLDQDPTVPLAGGTEYGLGSGAATGPANAYAVLRLATATGQINVDTRSNAVLTGWAGGLAEKENGPGGALTTNPIGSGTNPNNLVIQTDAANNRVQADLLLSGHAPMTLGGPNNPSAMIDDNRFAAANDSVAMVNANVLRDQAGKLPASLNLPNGQPIPTYQYLQWGFLLGDTAGKAGVDLEHLHMGTWIAGRAADPNQLPTTGSATYSGHAIGNVANGGALYTAVGSYDNTWNFAQRAGTVKMNFDGAQYSGTTQLTSGANFQGTMSAAGRAGGVVGNFVQAATGSLAGVPPPAVAGRFVIQETGGSPYRASGTFGAERSH